MRIRPHVLGALALVMILGAPDPTHADAGRSDHDRKLVVSAGGGLGIGGATAATEQLFPTLMTDVYLRIGHERPLPPAPLRDGTYRWRFSHTPELTLSRGSLLEDDPFVATQVGLRLDALFNQRKMGLFKISGRGGFWIAGRAGLLHDGATHANYQLDIGAHIALGRSKLRISYEWGVMAVPGLTGGNMILMLMRLGLGMYL